MKTEPDPRLEAAVQRALEGLRPVPAPSTLVGRVMAALPETPPVPEARGWPGWPAWMRWLVLTCLAGAAMTGAWALTLFVCEPAASQLKTSLQPLWAMERALVVMADAILTRVSSLPTLWWWSAIALVGSTLALIAFLGTCYVRLLQSTESSWKENLA